MPNSYNGAFDVINAFKSVDSFSGNANQLNQMANAVMNFGAEDRKNLQDFLNLVAPFYAEVVAGDPYPDINPRVGMTHDQLMDRERMYSVLIDAVRGRGPEPEPEGYVPESNEPQANEPQVNDLQGNNGMNQFGGRRRKYRKTARKHKKATRRHRANKNKSRKNKSRKNRGRK